MPWAGLASGLCSALMGVRAGPPCRCRCRAGHSMGGGTAAMMTMMLREAIPEFATARCYAIACPSCMTLELARSCREYVTSIVNGKCTAACRPQRRLRRCRTHSDVPTNLAPRHALPSCYLTRMGRVIRHINPARSHVHALPAHRISATSSAWVQGSQAARVKRACRPMQPPSCFAAGTDIVPTFSAATIDRLREDVMHSSWYAEFQRDMRTSVVRALQVGGWDGWAGALLRQCSSGVATSRARPGQALLRGVSGDIYHMPVAAAAGWRC